jgi:hypothetical protein
MLYGIGQNGTAYGRMHPIELHDELIANYNKKICMKRVINDNDDSQNTGD